MAYIGEFISLGVAFSLTVAALSCEVAGRRWGGLVLNVWRMLLGCVLSCVLTGVLVGYPLPIYAQADTWMWLALSGFVGYFFGDWCLLNSYLTIGSRYGQLLVTLSPMYAAVSAWLLMDEKLSWQSLIAMTVTIIGIAVSVLGRGESSRLSLQLPLKGVLYGIGAGVGQGLGLVLGMMGIKTYIAEVPVDKLPKIGPLLPFSANAIRCITGLICFTAWLLLKGEGKTFVRSMQDRKGMWTMIIAVISGPLVGVGFSLVAVQYTAAGIASTLMSMSPIVILLPSYYMFHQRLTVKGVIGAVISVIGVSLFFLL